MPIVIGHKVYITNMCTDVFNGVASVNTMTESATEEEEHLLLTFQGYDIRRPMISLISTGFATG